MNTFDYIGKLTESPYYEFMLETLHQLERSRKSRKKLERMESEIERYSGKHSRYATPDHRGFNEFASREYLLMDILDHQDATSRYQLLFDPSASDFPDFIYLLCIYVKYHRDQLEFERTHASMNKSDQAAYLHLQNTQALLKKFFELYENLVAVPINSLNSSSAEYLDENLKQLDGHELKSRFMAAVYRREKSQAFKLLGRLRDLDPGEEEYLESIAHFNNEEYRDAIRFASKVPETAPDYGASLTIKLDCLALLAEEDALYNALSKSIVHIPDRWYVSYLLQTLLLRTKFSTPYAVEAFAEKLQTTIINLEEKKAFTNTKESPRYIGLLRQNIAKASVELLTMFEEASRYEEEAELPDPLSSRILQLSYAVQLSDEEPIPKFVTSFFEPGETAESRKEQLSHFILPYLINTNPDRKFDNTALALKTQYQLGYVEDFTNNVIKNLKNLSLHAQSGEELASQLICLAYMELLATGQDDATAPDGSSLKTIAEQWMDHSDNLGDQINDRIIIDSLSPMGKLAYQAAEWQYRQTLSQDYGWKDAGMLSLAYYRILELEFNHRYVFPLVKNHYSSIRSAYKSHKKELGKDTPEFRDFEKKWSQNITSLSQTSSDIKKGKQPQGLMLGGLKHLFNDISVAYDDQDPVAKILLEASLSIMTEEGLRALNSGRIASIISDEKRDLYRNPPAHTRYLSYDKACECRDFVRETLLGWNSWWK